MFWIDNFERVWKCGWHEVTGDLIKMKPKTIFGLLGIILSILGWFLSNTDQISWFQNLISPKLTAFQENVYSIRTAGNILKKDNTSFEAVSQILLNQIDQKIKPQIITITTKNWGSGGGTDDNFQPIQGPYYVFDVILHTGQNLPMIVWNLEQKITDHSRSAINLWSGIIFWVGILISAFLIFH